MKKKMLIALSLVLVVMISLAVGAYAASDIKLFINGKLINTDLQVVDGSTYVPLRVVSDSLGADVKWDGDKREINITAKGSNPIQANVSPVNPNELALEYVNIFMMGSDPVAKQKFLEEKIHPDVKPIFELSVNLKKEDKKTYTNPRVIKSVDYAAGAKKGSLVLIQTDQEEMIILIMENKIGFIYLQSSKSDGSEAAYKDLRSKF